LRSDKAKNVDKAALWRGFLTKYNTKDDFLKREIYFLIVTKEFY